MILSFIQKISLKKILYLIAFLVPLNIGKHFEFSDSYVNGLLVDYYIPTIYIQDLLIIVLLFLWLLKGFPYFRKIPFYILFFLIVVFTFLIISSYVNGNYLSTYINIGRVFLYTCMSLYMYTNLGKISEIIDIVKALSISSFMVGILGILQWVNQGSIFNNYLILGEQPYTFSTLGIVRDTFFGFTRVPAYGLFRHPNVFAAFLVVVTLLLVSFIDKSLVNRKFYLVVAMNITCLIFTLSYYSWFVLVFGLVVFYLTKFKRELKTPLIVVSLLLTVLLNLLPLAWEVDFGSRIFDTSIRRRSYMLEESFNVGMGHPIFGAGLFQHIKYIDNYSDEIGDYRFIQPVHSIFALAYADMGFIVVTLLVFFFVYFMYKNLNVSVSVVLLLLMAFDHFFLTSHQGLLLFLLTVVILLPYNFVNEV